MGPSIGVCFHRTYPAPLVVEFAEQLETQGVDELWVIEDCFFTTAVSLAATALARTERLTVGLGILPAVARNAAVTAMEIATLAQLGSGRVVAGIGHGVQSWMEQMGARAASPVTALEEVITVVRQLLHGDTVSVEGRHVQMREVRLEAPPAAPPPVVAGVRGPRSLAAAGRCADGVVLAEGTGPHAVRAALARVADPASGVAASTSQTARQAARSAAGPAAGPALAPQLAPQFDVTVFSPLCITPDRRTAHRAMAPMIASWLDAGDNPALTDAPFHAELVERYRRDGVDGIVSMPTEWWTEFGAIGTMDDALSNVTALHAAGAQRVALFPSPDIDEARHDLGLAAELSRQIARVDDDH
jgi:5,10-methylenetetrahydromethanopterin reductase